MSLSKTALLIIDLQNDYFPGGAFPLWHAEEIKDRIIGVMKAAQDQGVHLIHIQHVADSSRGLAPFFNSETSGVAIHQDILDAAPDAPIVVKSFADGFEKTRLEEELNRLGVSRLLVCGMMTQNCVTHTAISRSAERYDVEILADCCTTVSEILHKIALNAVATRIAVLPSGEAAFG